MSLDVPCILYSSAWGPQSDKKKGPIIGLLFPKANANGDS